MIEGILYLGFDSPRLIISMGIMDFCRLGMGHAEGFRMPGDVLRNSGEN